MRFLVLVLVGWTGLRVAVSMPGAPEESAPRQVGPITAVAPATMRPLPPSDASGTRTWTFAVPAARPSGAHAPQTSSSPAPVHLAALQPPAMPVTGLPAAAGAHASAATPPVDPPTLATPRGTANRWSGSAWLLVRDELGGSVLAPGGTLGGSQAGGRLLYRLNDDAARALSLSARLYTPLRRAAGAEAAIGLDWRPVPNLPANILVERREALGDAGRSAFALTVYGGASANLPARLRFDAYAQAGVVCARSRDLFVDGAVRTVRPIGPVEIGAGAWGAAQPGASRLDAGPQVSWRLPVRGANLRLSADWRFRIAGDAQPESGPALTLGADF